MLQQSDDASTRNHVSYQHSMGRQTGVFRDGVEPDCLDNEGK